MSRLVSFVMIAQTTALIFVSLLLVYPLVAYARNVAHTRGLALLAGAFLALTSTYAVTFLYQLSTVSAILDLFAALLAAGGVWEFARPFVGSDEREIEALTVEESSGGFESARSD